MLRRNIAVLVVEDDALIRLGAVDFLDSSGFDVLEAKSADHAIPILETRPDIRLVFTDVDMPGSMDGIRLAHVIRDRWPATLLVVASGKLFVEGHQLPRGAKFFRKPYAESLLLEAMTSMLSASDAGLSRPGLIGGSNS